MAKFVTLADCPPGLFRFKGSLGFKSEYGAMELVTPPSTPGPEMRWTVGNRADAYCLDTGEYFWGGAQGAAERDGLLVEPITLADTLPLLEVPRLRLPEGIDRSRPVPILIKVAKDGEEPNCFYAPTAERFAVQLDWAEALEARVLQRNDDQTPEGWARRRSLEDAKALVAAPTIPASEWSDWVCDGEETYAASIEEFVEMVTDIDPEAEPPAYCWATYEKGFDFDLEDAIENYLADEHHEDAEESTLGALIDFYKEWRKTARVKTFFPAKEVVVIDPVRFAAKVEAAKALIAEAGQ
jgi:hypothetical protein